MLSHMIVGRRFLRPLKKTAVAAVYRNRSTYPLRFNGRTTHFSIEGAAAHFFFYCNLAFGRVPEKSVTQAMVDDLGQASCFADIGANLGYYTALARTFMPEKGVVHTFEMDSENHAVLLRNVELNPSSVQVHANNVALAAAPGSVTYDRLPESASPVLSLHRVKGEQSVYTDEMEQRMVQVTVPAITLDSYFAAKELLPDLVKIDVEGAEVDVLKGMPEVLGHVKRLYVEVHPRLLAEGGHRPSEVLELLADRFRLHIIPDHRSQHPTDQWVEIQPNATITTNTIIRASTR